MAPERTALVTGSSRGLGRGIARKLAAQGFSVAIHAGRNRAAAEETVRLCSDAASSPEQVFPIFVADLADAAAIADLAADVLARFGRLDALVNNAGMAPRERRDVVDAEQASFDELMAVNTAAPHLLTQCIARHWIEHAGQSAIDGGYKLVFVGSISATTVSTNRAEYCISKAALAMVNRVWAARLAPEGVQSIEVRPGIMATDMTETARDKYEARITGGDLVPQGRWGTPDDVGSAVAAFVGGALPFVTGDVLNVDGGFHLSRL